MDRVAAIRVLSADIGNEVIQRLRKAHRNDLRVREPRLLHGPALPSGRT
jgi:hypothetical protein